MATGDQTDTAARARAVLPGGWFPGTAAATVEELIIGPGDPLIIGPGEPLLIGASSPASTTPVLYAVLAGPAWGWAWLYGLLQYVAQQKRISSATDSNLDLIGGDYFSTTLLRKPGETDTAYRQRILANLLAPRGTRQAVMTVLEQLTGQAPQIFEPWRPADTGGWGDIAQGQTVTGLGYGVAGGYGNLSIPAQFFVRVNRPSGGGIAGAAGWGTPSGYSGMPGGYGVGALEYGNPSQIANEVTDADIYAAVNLSRPAAVTAWVAIEGSNAAQLGVNFAVGYSTLS